MYTSKQVSSCILEIAEREGFELTSRRLQLILFMIQRYFCEFHNKRLIDDEMLALSSRPICIAIDEDFPNADSVVDYDSYKTEKALYKKDRLLVDKYMRSYWELYRKKTDFALMQKIKNDVAFKKAANNPDDNEIYYRYFVEELQYYDY